MKRLTAVMFALCICIMVAVPAFASDAPSAAVFSLDWQNGADTGRTWLGKGAIDFPLGLKLLSVGPVLEARYYSADVNPDPDDTGSLTLFNIGGQVVMYTTASHRGVSFGAEFLYVSNDATGYLIVPFVGLDLGWGDGQGAEPLFRARWSHPYHQGYEDGTIDLERNEVTAGFGLQF